MLDRIACEVIRRTRESGIRMNGLALTAAGIVLGAAGAAGATRLLRTLRIGVSPTDPLAFALAGLGLGAIGGLAWALRARRATRSDRVVALRNE